MFIFINLLTGLSDQIGSGRSDSLVSQCLISSSPHLISPHLSLELRLTLSLPDLILPRLSLQSRLTPSHITSPLFSHVSPFSHLISHPSSTSFQFISFPIAYLFNLVSPVCHLIPSPTPSTSSHLFVTSSHILIACLFNLVLVHLTSHHLSLQPRLTFLSPHRIVCLFNIVTPSSLRLSLQNRHTSLPPHPIAYLFNLVSPFRYLIPWPTSSTLSHLFVTSSHASAAVSVAVDASASTFWNNDEWWRLPENCGRTEPLFTTAHYIRRLTPQARIIVILRNPTER